MATEQFDRSPQSGVDANDIDRRHQAATLKLKWGRFFVLGIVLVIAGVLAIALPEISAFATGSVFGIALGLAGVAKMALSLQIKEWSGFLWQELTGAAEVVGGILIYFNPLKGALAIALLIALVLLVQSFLQIALAFRIRKQNGWQWFALSSLVSLAASAALVIKLPFTIGYEPGVIAGITLLVAGIAYIAIAFTMRSGQR
ncbi:HdeD family acid-resistance protein [Afipia felis]|nr:HdeD family acid-resistance protein [Afipia felis]